LEWIWLISAHTPQQVGGGIALRVHRTIQETVSHQDGLLVLPEKEIHPNAKGVHLGGLRRMFNIQPRRH
jgi:hypothetical protein